MEVDPYKLFGLTKNFTLDELKAKFKNMAMVTHPDKGGSEQLFLLVVNAFKKLLEEHNRRVSDKTHAELKAAFEQSTSQRAPSRGRGQVEGVTSAAFDVGVGDRFNVDKFNQVFDSNRLDDPVATGGYQDWMRTQALPEVDDAPKKPIPKSKFNVNNFNKTFEKKTQSLQQDNKFVAVYKEPEPLLMAKKMQFTELGVDKVDDYSGDNTTKRNLNYMDYKIAHTTSRIVDPNVVRRKEYTNINELEGERSRIQFNMSHEDYEYEMHKKKMAEEAERQRLETLDRQRQIEEAHFTKLQRLMLASHPQQRL